MPEISVLQPPSYITSLPSTADLSRLSGVVIRVRFRQEELSPGALQSILGGLARVARRAPRAPLVVTVLGCPPSLDVALLILLRRLDCALVIPDRALSLNLLRRNLPDLAQQPECLVKWFTAHTQLQLAGTAATHLLEAGLGAPPSATMPPVAATVPLSVHGVSARDWFDLGRALRSATAVQRCPEGNLAAIALSLGFHDASSISRHLKRILGHRPPFIRPRLGWHWLLHDWAVARIPHTLALSPPPVFASDLATAYAQSAGGSLTA